MIDFRYHLVSIMAVLIALSIGVVLGTGTLGGPLLDDLENNVRELRARNADLESEISTLEDRIQTEESFAEAAHPYVIQGALQGRPAVVIEMQGADGALADQVRSDIARAGGTTTTTIELREKLALREVIDADELALAISSVQGAARALREEAAQMLGSRLAAAATGASGSGATPLLEDLQTAGFIDVERDSEEGSVIPQGATFFIVGGRETDAPFDIAPFIVQLSTTLGGAGAPTLVAEPSLSLWELVSSIRADGDARDSVSTVDNVDTLSGRAAVVLGMERILSDEVGHFGRGPGAEQLLPEPQEER